MSVNVECANCSVAFCLPEDLHGRRKEDHKTFYCPNGHSNYYPQETAKESKIRNLESRLNHAEARIAWLKQDIAERDHELRSLRSKLAWRERRLRLFGQGEAA